MQSGGSVVPDILTLMEFSLNGTEINELMNLKISGNQINH